MLIKNQIFSDDNNEVYSWTDIKKLIDSNESLDLSSEYFNDVGLKYHKVYKDFLDISSNGSMEEISDADLLSRINDAMEVEDISFDEAIKSDYINDIIEKGNVDLVELKSYFSYIS